MLEAVKDTIFVAPAPGLLYARCHEAQEFGIGSEKAALMGATSGLQLLQQVIPKMRKRGIRVLPGGDYGFPYNPVGRNARDLGIFVDLFGFSPIETLVAATRLGGELMDMPLGQIRPNYLADLLVVSGDPTTDVTILENKNNLAAIVKGGIFYKDQLSSALSH